MYGGTSGYFTLSSLANQPPVAVDDTASTTQNTNVSIDVLDNDSDPDDLVLTLSIDTQATNGTATVDTKGTATPTDDTIDYLPNANFTGTDTFVYQVDDGNAASGNNTDTATVTVTVTAIVLDAVDDPVTTQMDTPIDIDVLANDNSSNPVTLTTATAPANGTAVVDDKGTPAILTDDTIDYTPNTGFIGQDTFTYQIDDGAGTDIATVTVTINGQPTATNDNAGNESE